MSFPAAGGLWPIARLETTVAGGTCLRGRVSWGAADRAGHRWPGALVWVCRATLGAVGAY